MNRRWIGALIVVLIGTTLVAPPASAHNFTGANGTQGCTVNVTDDANVTYHYTTTTMPSAAMRDAMLWARQNNLTPTDLDTQGFGDWDGSLDQRDVIGYSADYTGVSCGLTWCDTAGSCAGRIIGLAMVHGVNAQNEGRQHRLYFDSDVFGQGTQFLRALACHENGHAVGLTHTGGTCMTNPVDPAQIGFSADQIGHINAHY